MHRTIDKSKHLYVFLISSIIFLFGVLIGAQVEQFRIENLENRFQEENLKYEEIQAEIDYINFLVDKEDNSKICPTLTDSYLKSVKNLDESVFSLENYRSTAEFKTDEYESIKTQYFNLEMRYYILAEKINSLCDNSFDTILYFYGDNKECPECEDQGIYLDYVKKKYQDEVMIFSFDSQSSSDVVRILVTNNNVTIDNLPRMIINGNNTLSFSDSETIESYLTTIKE
jgi:hypothetical protein